MASPHNPSAASIINSGYSSSPSSSSSSSSISNLQEGNVQTLSDIAELQNMELEYFNQLNDGLTNNTLSQTDKDSLTQKINEISQMRINLYSNLNGAYDFYNANVAMSRTTMDEQTAAIQIVENELNEAKRRLKVIEEEKQNKLRLVEISTYYGQKYDDHSSIMKTIIIFCIPILILSFLYNRGLIRSSIYAILFIIIGLIGLVVLARHLFDTFQRDNMYYDEYNWLYVAPDNKAVSGDSKDPWNNGGGGDGCIKGEIDSLTNSIENSVMNIAN